MKVGKAERAGRHMDVPNEGVQAIATTGVPDDFDPPSAALIQSEPSAEKDARREADVLIEAGHPSRPDREELMRQHIARIKARAWDEGYHAGRDHGSGGARLVNADGSDVDYNPYRVLPPARGGVV